MVENGLQRMCGIRSYHLVFSRFIVSKFLSIWLGIVVEECVGRVCQKVWDGRHEKGKSLQTHIEGEEAEPRNVRHCFVLRTNNASIWNYRDAWESRWRADELYWSGLSLCHISTHWSGDFTIKSQCFNSSADADWPNWNPPRNVVPSVTLSRVFDEDRSFNDLTVEHSDGHKLNLNDDGWTCLLSREHIVWSTPAGSSLPRDWQTYDWI